MAESIKGSNSSLYIKEEVPGVVNSADTMNHLSVQNLCGRIVTGKQRQCWVAMNGQDNR